MTAYPHELQAFQELGNSFARRELVDKREEHDRYPFAPFWHAVLRQAAELGFFTITLAERWGGIDAGTAALVPLCEEISCVDASLAGVIFTNAAALEIINVASESSDCELAFAKLAGADALPLAFPSYTGPDQTVLPTARADASGTAITGTVRNLALAGIAKHAVIAAANADGSCNYFLTDLGGRGVSVSATVPCIGFRACPIADVTFEAAAALSIGTLGSGFDLYRGMMKRLAPVAAAILMGILKGCFEEAYRYAQERRQGGRAILDWPAVAMMLAEMAADIRLAETCLIESLNSSSAATALAIRLGEWTCRATTNGVQVLGGYGYTSDYGQEKRMRDARMARQLLGMPTLRKQDLFDEQWRA